MKLLLVVSDDALVKEIAGMLGEDLQVIIVDSFNRAQEILLEVIPTDIVTDLNLGGTKTGIDVARLVQKRTPRIPVVIVTASDITGKLLEQARNAGVMTTLSKAIGVKALQNKIIHLLDLESGPAQEGEK